MQLSFSWVVMPQVSPICTFWNCTAGQHQGDRDGNFLDSHIHPFAMISSEHHLLRTYMSSANIQPIQSVYVFFRWSTFKCSCARRYRFFTATRGLTRIDLVFPCPAIPSQNHSMRSPLIKPLVCATKSWWSTPKPKLSTVVANILCK